MHHRRTKERGKEWRFARPKDSIEENTTVLLIALINEAWGIAEPLFVMKSFWKFIPGEHFTK